MAEMIVNASVTVIRDGKRVTPPVGSVFAFTKEESDYINSVSAGAVRKPVNESKSAAAEPVVPSSSTGAEVTAAADATTKVEKKSAASTGKVPAAGPAVAIPKPEAKPPIAPVTDEDNDI